MNITAIQFLMVGIPVEVHAFEICRLCLLVTAQWQCDFCDLKLCEALDYIYGWSNRLRVVRPLKKVLFFWESSFLVT